MKVKHSKYKNTGLIFELLVKQIAADTLSRKDSPAVKILRKFYTGNTSLVREFKLYDFVLKNKGIGQKKAEAILSTIVELSRKIDTATLSKQKYELIKELKNHYNLEDFFSIKVESYKPLAALYCLMEAQNTQGLVDPQVFVDNKTTLLEHFLQIKQDGNSAKDTLIEEYSKYDKDLRLLTYKILLEKFNDKYVDLLPEQKNILKEFIVSVNSSTRLRNVVNEEMTKLQTQISKLKNNITDKVVKIKLEEVAKAITPVKNTQKVDDNHLVSLMQYYELVNELKDPADLAKYSVGYKYGLKNESINEGTGYEYKDDSGAGKPTKVLKLDNEAWEKVKDLFDDKGRPKSDEIKRIPSDNSIWDLYAQSYDNAGGKTIHKIYGVSGDYSFGNAPTYYQQKLSGNKKAAVRVFDYFIKKYLK